MLGYRNISGTKGTHIRVFIILLFGCCLFACSDELEGPEPVEYEDPDTPYGPPSLRNQGVVGKADSLSQGPRIIRVSWRSEPSCRTRGISDVLLSVVVQDADDDTSELTFEGAVTGCDNATGYFGPMVNQPITRLRCHQVSAHTGLVTVVDPSGAGDSFAFRFEPCSDGTADTDAN